MGQALRSAAARLRTSKFPTQTTQHVKNVDSLKVDLSKEGNVSGVVEERDSTYDEMLNTMVGRITSKPGGKLEMGEAFIVEKYNRPMPKVRSSKVEVKGEENPLSSGSLEIPQLKQILLLHAGKSEEHSGPMSIESIAEKFKIDPAQVKNILRFVSLPPEEKVNEKSESHRDI